MFEENICRFIPQSSEQETIHTLNFVYEKDNSCFDNFRLLATYRLHLVTKGRGKLNTPGKSYPLQEGDLFFVFPSAPYLIEAEEELEYMYISFIGTRANHILDALHIGQTNILFSGFSSLIPVWTNGILSGSAMFQLASEGVLLYTLSMLASRLIQDEPVARTATATVTRIKKYIDDHFSDGDLSLERMATELSYNPKYISRTFKKEMGVSVTDYINTIRIHQACTLMDQGFTSIRDISQMCGYNDPMYFSRVFKKEFNISPREYIENK